MSMALWGSNPKYTDGAVATAQAVQRLPLDTKVVLYHDDSVPQSVLARLAQCKVILKRAPDWPGERRAMWRFLALGEYRRVFFLDADSSPSLLLARPTVQALMEMSRASTPGLWTWIPGWRHETQRCVPACFTGVVLDKLINTDRLTDYVKTHRVLTGGSQQHKQHRYKNGYGLDEWWLTRQKFGPLRTIPYHRVR